MATAEFDTVCEEYARLAAKEAELRENLRDVSAKKKELEDVVKAHMEANNLIELPFARFNIRMREKLTKKPPKKDHMLQSLALKLDVPVDTLSGMYDELKSEALVRRVKAVVKA